jgi:ATP-dependent DNA helicase RecQ
VLAALHTARDSGLKIAVVTKSPTAYAQKLLTHFELKIDYLVAYHDVKRQKPDPEGINNVLARFGLKPEEAVYVGDADDDRVAAKAASVKYFAVDWSDGSLVPPEDFGVGRLLELIGSRAAASSSDTQRAGIVHRGKHYYLGYYLDGIKQEVWAFKNGHPKAVARWLGKCREASGTLPAVDVVVRALGHDEAHARPAHDTKPLDQVGAELAKALNATYCPGLLRKDKTLVKSTKCTASQRKAQVSGAYRVDPSALPDTSSSTPTFLIVDDVLTSGATTDEVERALREQYPRARVFIFTLVKTLFGATSGESSAETQHNAQLLSDLYRLTANARQAAEVAETDLDVLSGSGLVTKKYSAGYCNTNHNFVLQNLRSYSIASEPDATPVLNAVYILKNILQRGRPTIPSRRLREAFGYEGVASPQPLISRSPVTWRRLIRGNDQRQLYPAQRFFDELIPKYLGEFAFIKQLALPEVQINDMTGVYVERYRNRQVDFYIPHVGVIIEIDGPQHLDSIDSDEDRDAFARKLGLRTIRFTTQEVASEGDSFQDKMAGLLDHIRRVDDLERKGLLIPPGGLTLDAYRRAFDDGIALDSSSIRLTAAIRFQLVLLELIERGDIRPGSPAKIFLRNRDNIAFPQEALDDLSNYWTELTVLLGIEDKALAIEVVEVENLSSVQLAEGIKVDFSILERFDDRFQVNPDIIFVRTDYFDFYRLFYGQDSNRLENYSLEPYDHFQISCAAPIAYELDLSPGSRQREALKFFLVNLFLPTLEEAEFREGQVGIIGSALARKNTIGLLPTGSGKSICYQLASILQPAISFVVCPIKSLMYDQKADLDAIGFTRCNFITGDLKSDEKAKIQSEYGRGKYFFVFISPERFQTRNFRSEMHAIGLNLAFSYAVIDEAHCLSEWGHDFRTSYLCLSNAIRLLAPDASCIGLTATASVNVLKDIQTEFNVPDENVRTPISFGRDELSFHVINDRGRKRAAAHSLVKQLEAKWNAEEKDKAGIIFTATVNGDKGCFELAASLSRAFGMDVRFFSGQAPKRGPLQLEAFEEYKRTVQREFKENKYRLLAATKAFGMGVNKGNVAYTIHYGIPGSMEALYQEAGRAGRDKKQFSDTPADCYVLLTKEDNVEVLDKIWDASAKVPELRQYLDLLGSHSDISTNLWFQLNSLDSIKDEYNLIARILRQLYSNKDMQNITLGPAEFGSDSFRFQRAIYRLHQLGVVLDWTVEDFYKGILNIDFCQLDENLFEENLVATIRKYEPGFTLDNLASSTSESHIFINEKINSGAINKIQYVVLALLIWSYDHFAYNRRQSLKTVYEQCSYLADGQISEAEFKSRLEAYFKFNNSTLELHSLAENAQDTRQWLTVFFEEDAASGKKKTVSLEKLSTLKEQLSRFLESYKDNACLNYISGVMRLASDQFDDADGERRMARALEHLARHSPEEVEVVIRDTLELRDFFSTESKCRYAKIIHETFPDGMLLEMINSSFKDPYSYRVLLQPLAKRLEGITEQYKRTAW